MSTLRALEYDLTSLRVTDDSDGSTRSSLRSTSTMDSSELSDTSILPSTDASSSAELFGIQLEVTALLLEAERRKLDFLQKDLIQELSSVTKAPSADNEIAKLKSNIWHIQKQYSVLDYEYRMASMAALKRQSQLKPQSSRSQPAIGLKQTPKPRPSIFGNITNEITLSGDQKGCSEWQDVSLAHMFDMASKGYRLTSSRSSDALVFENGNLVSGSLEALVHHLLPTPSYHPDRTYTFAFLLCSRLYIQPHRLLQEICLASISQLKVISTKSARDKLEHFGQNLVKLLSEWTELFPYDFRDERMMRHLQDITKRIVALSPSLKRNVTSVLHALVNRLESLVFYENILSRLNAEIMYRSKFNEIPITDAMEICGSPLLFAQQLTHIELERLSQIGPEEFIQTFCKEDKSQKSVSDIKRTWNLECYIQWFNRLSYFVATEICTLSRKKSRVNMIEFFIDVAKECINIGNFNSLMAIIGGLNMSSVSRLKKTWEKVPEDKFNIVSHHMDPSNNFSVYRTCLKAAVWRSQSALHEQEKIVIPFFTVFIKDIYFLNECCTNSVENGRYLNFHKFWQLAKLISEFMTFQHVLCPFEKNSEILHYLLTTPIFTETSLSLASFECEAPETSWDKNRQKSLKSQLSAT